MPEQHPFTPFLPDGARLLMLGTFPPSPKRWAMKFYYPNFTNDMWRIVGHCFFGEKMHFVRQKEKTYDLPALTKFLEEKGIALYDTCTRIIRTKNTASDKDLQVVEETDLVTMLRQLPECRAVVTAGQLATEIACRQLAVSEPKMGEYVVAALSDRRSVRLYRMPSSSRAYPLSIEKKANYYQLVFDYIAQQD